MADLIVRLNLYNTGMKRTREARPERLAMPAVQPRAARPAIVADLAAFVELPTWRTPDPGAIPVLQVGNGGWLGTPDLGFRSRPSDCP